LAHEGYGLVVLESLAMGTPVVASDVDGLLDAADVSSFVTTFDSGSLDSLVSALQFSLNQSPLQSEVARDVATLAWPNVAQRFESLYEDLLIRVEEPSAVLVLDHTARLSGGELALGRTAEALKQNGHYIPHVILFESGPFEAELRRRGVTHEVLAMNSRTQSRRRSELGRGLLISLVDTVLFSWRLRRVVRQRGVRLIHTNSLKAFVIGTLISFCAPWRLVAHVRDMWDPPYLSRRTSVLLRALLAWRSDGVIANSVATAHAASVDATVIYSPVDGDFFSLDDPTPQAVLRIGVIGRIAAWKGQDLMLEALALLGDLSLQVTFVGGALFDELEFQSQLTKSAQVFGDRVQFLGAVDNVVAAMAEFDVTVLTSRSPEPFGNVVTEAMAAGRVVVVPRQGGVLDFVVDDQNGLFYQPNDAESLASVIRRISEGHIDRRAIGARAREAASHYGAPRMAHLVESVYESVLK
jgi:glycosyltransferase involved in cell wall biosynthesis